MGWLYATPNETIMNAICEMVEKAIAIGCDGLISNYPDWGLKAVGR